MLLKVVGQLLHCDLVDYRLHLGITQLALSLTLELAFRQLDGDYRVYRLADSLAAVTGERLLVLLLLGGFLLGLILLLVLLIRLRVVVHDLIERLLETQLVGTTLAGVDIVRKGPEDLGVEIRGVLERNLHVDPVHIAGEIDNVRVENVSAALLVEPLDVALDSALVHHLFVYGILGVAGIGQRDLQTAVKERLLTQSVLKRGVVEFRRVEYLPVRLELYGSTGAVGGADNLYRLAVFTAL